MRLKGSYTVEASMIISFSFLVFGMAVCIGFELFKSTVEYVSYKPDTFDAVQAFRLKEGVVGIFNAIRN
ncbi:hypothetical protein SAMN02910384_01608 [Pseudobutyrivibrio sp. ACV-2]|uniref:hypothetical protein n=1 Tax=Pseudobutyrivibrio sp. ACV-2 TaxID=1520801 RepID=UPI00089AB7F3|nr:hypothetical protein [Pseudobutyrivibrio sp. ACV-2]SEA48418.1 hypothetical protein SAMN02910384_01608 [Pseudobutyrivibrio sp. ACV-2]